MGITVSPATSASGGSGSGSSLPVVPGTSVTQEIYTDVGFTTGDYVYRYGRGNVGPVFPITVPVANSVIAVNGAISTNTIGSGTIAKSSITAPQVAPATVTYTGSSTTFGTNTLAQTVISASAPTVAPEIAVLTNGNIVSVFAGTPNTTLLYQITTPAGVAVANGTVTTTMRAYSGIATPYHVCALNAGGFVVAYSPAGVVNTVIYNADGSVARAIATASGAGQHDHPYLAVSSTDQIYLSTTATSACSAAGNLASLTTAGAIIAQLTVGGGYFPSGKMPIAVNTAGLIGGIVSDNASTSGNSIANFFTCLPALASVANNSTFNGPNANYPSIAATASNYFIACSLDGSNNATLMSYNPTTNSFSSPALTFGPAATQSAVKLIPYSGGASYSATTTNNGALLLYASSNDYRVVPVTIASPNTLSAGSSTSLATTSTSSPNTMPGAQLLNGNFVLAYRTSTPNVAIKTFSSFTLANGTTVTTPASVYPTYVNGYYLLGVATTTAAAGTSGTIAINGQAPLSASYGTSSTPLGFDYNPFNRGGIPNGNTGYVINRMVILKGLEQ
jgi:hypothetical protein